MVMHIEMCISILFTFASTTVKIYLEFSENELFEKMKCLIISASLSSADVSQFSLSTNQSPLRPYTVSFTPGRFNGHNDRAHFEVFDGIAQRNDNAEERQHELFNRIAQRNDIAAERHHELFNRIAQRNDNAAERHHELFNRIAQGNNNPSGRQPEHYNEIAQRDANARQRHFTLYNQIAAEHARIGAERARTGAERAPSENGFYYGRSDCW